jgi:thioredoxin reductase
MTSTQQTQPVRDVIVIGGGAAGLSAALTLARARRTVTVIDAGQPRNAAATGAHGLLGNEGINPQDLLARGRSEAQHYGAEIIQTPVSAAQPLADGFQVTLEDERELHALQLLVATGVRDVLPEIDGLGARWGRDVVHCPYCHGWEIRDQTLGVIATSATSAYQAVLFQQWTQDVTLFRNGFEFDAEALSTLAAVDIPVIDTPVEAVEITHDEVSGLRLSNGRTVGLQAIGVSSGMRANLEGLEALGLATYDTPQGTFVNADDTGYTNVPGVWAAGNIMDPDLQISECASQGARVAITLNNELIFARADAALTAARKTG